MFVRRLELLAGAVTNVLFPGLEPVSNPRLGDNVAGRGLRADHYLVELRSTDSRGRLSPHNLNAKSREGRGKCVIFTSQKQNPTRAFHRFLSIQSAELLVWRGICVRRLPDLHQIRSCACGRAALD